VTERKFGRRALNLIFPDRPPPHLASETVSGILRSKRPLCQCIFTSQIHATQFDGFSETEIIIFTGGRDGIVRKRACKMPGVKDFFTHRRDFHAFWLPTAISAERTKGGKSRGPSMREYDSRTFSERGSPSHLQLSPVLRKILSSGPTAKNY
jgi:hypothetical protein